MNAPNEEDSDKLVSIEDYEQETRLQAYQLQHIIDSEIPGLPSPEVNDESQYISIFEKISDAIPEKSKHRIPKKKPKKKGAKTKMAKKKPALKDVSEELDA